MKTELMILCITALSIGFIHTLVGPDHYLPFIMMKRARNWSIAKTMVITFFCGVGHIMSSVLLGAIGIVFGIGVMKLEVFEAFRGNIAAWALIGFGLAYFIWGLHRAVKNKKHTHIHIHSIGEKHSHTHAHSGKHGHVHSTDRKSITPWVLFTIFVLGPCEPLIPLLMYPAAKNSMHGLFIVTAIFGAATIMTMLGMVLLSSWGITFVRLGKLERYVHAIAGGTICLSGLAIQVFGL
ncbi:MAG: sulfite exporter TauE/SafE family protein [Candidatus Omnitrophota bacterium]